MKQKSIEYFKLKVIHEVFDIVASNNIENNK